MTTYLFWGFVAFFIAGQIFLLGMNYGEYRERRWQRQRQQDAEKFRYYEAEIAEIQRLTVEENQIATSEHVN